MTEFAPILTADDVNRLVELLERQTALFTQLEALGERQAALIADGEAETLLTLLAQRQQFIDRLQVVNTDLDPYRRRWPEVWAALDEANQTRVGTLVRQAQDILEKVMANDERDRRRLQSAQQQVATELGQVQQSNTARQAYQRSGGVPGVTGSVSVLPAPTRTGGNRFTDKLG